MTTMRAAKASLRGIRSLREQGFGVKCIQEYHPTAAKTVAAGLSHTKPLQ
jgi:hypothetical protein